MRAEDAPGGGARFVVELPVEPLDEPGDEPDGEQGRPATR